MSFNIQSLKRTAETRVSSELNKAAYGVSRLTAASLINKNNKHVLLERKDTDINVYDIFLSHSSRDANMILGILEELKKLGYSVYVDWVDDAQLDRSNVTEATAKTLRIRMNQSKSLFYATTKHASGSKWMPWELGYMDGKRDKTAILPVFESERSSSHTYKGQEYLGIYPYCIKATSTSTSNPTKEYLWIFKNPNTYINFNDWLLGKKPI